MIQIQALMTEEEILTLCGTGVLTVSKGSHPITAHGFPNPMDKRVGLFPWFGFFENQERVSLNIPEGMEFYAVINTAKGNPATLANEFLEKLEKSKISSARVSTL